MADITGNIVPSITKAEHDTTGTVNTKKVLLYGWDPVSMDKIRLSVNSSGYLNTITTLTATDLDIRNLVFATDKVDVSGSTGVGVTGTFWQATQPVSGTFYQTTQPVSIATMPSTPVTGTFWQATQPVSGTFWQTTQPVSIATMPSTPVTGTFWQATQPVSGTVTAVNGITTIGHGVKTITTAGTDEALAASTACKKVTIQAQTDNTTAIAVGAAGVDATEATGTGILLFPGDSFELEIDNLADIYIDATVSTEGVRYVYYN